MTETNPATEVETPETEGKDRDDKGRFASKEVSTDDESPEADSTDDADEPQLEIEPEEEFEEVDYEGKRYSIPKPLRKAILQEADYTRKTQEVAAKNKHLAEREQQIQETAKMQQEDFAEHASLHALKTYLDRFTATNWAEEMDKDPIETNKKFMEWQSLKGQFQERSQTLQQKQSERALQAQRDSAKREEEGRDVLRREIKGYSPELESSLKGYAKSLGLNGEVNLAQFPQETKVLHKAYLYDQLLRKSQQKPTPDPKPVKTVGQSSRSTPKGLSDELSVDEWVARREAELRRKT